MKKPLTSIKFQYAIQSFLGYLEGTEKSAHTIKNYRFDLLSFQSFLCTTQNSPQVSLQKLSQNDLKNYHFLLKSQKLKTNTQRRKLLTIQKFFRYLTRRKKLPIELARKFPTPHKIERIPYTVSSAALLKAIQGLPQESLLDARNHVLLSTLVETACLVSEVTSIQFENWIDHPSDQTQRYQIQFRGKSPRVLPVSTALYTAVQNLRKKAGEKIPWLFLGFNRFGPLGSPITPRGVELLVKHYAPKLGYSHLTPRILRHSTVLEWFKSGLNPEEIRKKLGLKTLYAFRVYEPILNSLKSTTQTTSTS